MIFRVLLIFSIFLTACGKDFTPKPKGYPRIEFPKKEFQEFNSSCPFTFRYPVYSMVIPDSTKGAEPCWMNIYYGQFQATLYLSYKPITNDTALYGLIEDSHQLVYKHTIKAEEINENYISTKDNVNGIVYELSGNTATPLQFYFTDSTNHFLRGSFYFNVKTNPDSVAPVMEFLKSDVLLMVKSLRWKN